MDLQIAMNARIPILRATTSDIVNLPEVLEHLANGVKVGTYTARMNNGTILYAIEPTVVDSNIYNLLVDQNQTLVLINQDDDSGLSLSVGEVPVPYEMLFDLVEGCSSKTKAYKLMVAFKGLTLKSASETIRLIRAQKKDLTVENVLHERSQMTGKLNGLTLVEVDTPCYIPNSVLAQWVATEKPYFHGAIDPRLVPRGLMFEGIPGTGKTQGAKYIAREFGVSLYRLDMSSALSKWVGQSEQNFGRVLSALDQEEPCVFLIDEVEKLFESGGEDAGTTSRILSQLLWWTQEHSSRILTVMTTNNKDALPAELYRNGRIDRVVTFTKLSFKDTKVLVDSLCESFKVTLSLRQKAALFAKITGVAGGKSWGGITPAAVTQIVYDTFKEFGIGLP